MKGNREIKIITSFHRPYHEPIWIIKWVCYFLRLRQKTKDNFFISKDFSIDLYFRLLVWFRNFYPSNNKGIPSLESVNSAWNYFNQFDFKIWEPKLKEILDKPFKNDIEKKIYSSYKAASYYFNLAHKKLRFIDNNLTTDKWNESQLTKKALKSEISPADRIIYIKQILLFDAHAFLSLCLIIKNIKKIKNSKLELDVLFFSFLKEYYSSSNFDFNKSSHKNYLEVRLKWIDYLKVLNKNGSLNKAVVDIIQKDTELLDIFNDIKLKISNFSPSMKEENSYNAKKLQFIHYYNKNLKIRNEQNNFVNLYDISKDMKLTYSKFQSFLAKFYNDQRLKRNIFFINIVSTIDQRKRFFIGKSPVLKIKMK